MKGAVMQVSCPKCQGTTLCELGENTYWTTHWGMPRELKPSRRFMCASCLNSAVFFLYVLKEEGLVFGAWSSERLSIPGVGIELFEDFFGRIGNDSTRRNPVINLVDGLSPQADSARND